MLGGAAQAGGPYEIPNLHIDGYCVYTNQVPCGYMRAPGQPQVVFAVEAHMDLLARAIGMDPVELRLRNAPGGTESGEPKLAQLLRAARDAVDWDIPKAPFVGRGVAVTDRGTGAGEGSSDITVNPDGTISVISAIPDNGTGGPTVIVQVVADAFGVPLESIHLNRGGTDVLPIDAGSGGSRMTNVAGHAALTASDQVKQQLAPLAAKMLGSDSAEFVKVEGQGRWRATNGREVSLADFASEMIKAGDPAAHAQVTVNAPRSGERVYCAQAVEVEVDPETGDVLVRKIATVQDVGAILNPLGHQGQIEGGLMQGVGFALSEELVVEDGRITNGHFGDYKIPTMQDIPRLITINVPTAGGNGPLDVKGIGELPHVPIAGAIANAVADAIGAPITQLPITAERVLAAMEGARAPQ
jgi:CO/xanthine dehydrogenase Mo-binding subunit